ncbi:MAG: NgoFVII family restriction endonuclease [Patescibacteria group bacterium]
MLKCIGSLSRLFSESKEPYIQYRIAENLFCKSFNAKNLSRTDCSADASKDRVGIGIKTFLEVNGSTWQKVAEFNGDHGQFKSLGDKEKVKKVANLRNIRIDTTKRIFDLDKMIYHCVTRKPGRILVYELPMDSIVVGDIKKIKKNKNIISFDDGLNSYSFNISKSTLYKRFNTGELLLDLPVEILDDPFDSLEKLLSTTQESISFSSIKKQEHIFLPLYSMKDGKKVVPDKSGLNQWKASGRKRDYNEIYIPIPSWIHSKFPGFFPSRDTAFTLILPNGKEMSAKLCQDGSKALMSNPNSDLGKWLLRDVLNLKEGEVLNYDFLDNIGLDSVVIYKNNEGEYDIDFTAVGSYEDFKEESY